jgi:hypothetical protein
MAKSNVFMNYKAVTWQQSGGSATPLTQVTDVTEMRSEEVLFWQADGNIFPTLAARASASRGVTISSGDVAGMQAIPVGVPLTIVAVLNDAVNKAGPGALTETWVNAVVMDNPSSGPSNKFAGGTITLMCYSADGAADPHTTAQA